MVKKAALKKRLLKRDGYRCGVHVGGCGRKLTLAITTIDHIVPQNILRIDPAVYAQLAKDESFLQPMCQDCNSARKQGRLDVAFTCNCHSTTFFSLFGRPELLVSYTKGYVIRRLRISAEESPDGTYLFVWGRTKKGTVGYKPDQFGGVFEYPSSFPDGSSVIRTFRPINVSVQKELIASCQEVQLVLVEHLDLYQIASDASLTLIAIGDALQSSIQSFVRQHSGALLKLSRAISLLIAIGDALQSSIQSFVRQHSGALLKLSRAISLLIAIGDALQSSIQSFVRQHSGASLELSRAISLAGGQYTHLTSSMVNVPNRRSSKSDVQATLAATRDTNRLLPDASQRIVRQMSLASRRMDHAFATPGMQQMLIGTRALNRVMVDAAWQCAKQMSLVSREINSALATPRMQQMLAGIREMNRASSQASLYYKRQYALVSPDKDRFPMSRLRSEQ